MLVLVGEAFGEDEEAEGVPFVGRAGSVLDFILHNIGLPRDRLYITNLLNERPSPHAKEQKDKNDIRPYFHKGQLTPLGLSARDGLLDELSSIQCPLIIPLGNTALAALSSIDLSELAEDDDESGVGEEDEEGNLQYNFKGIQKWRGSPLLSPSLPGRLLVPSLHPAFIARGASASAHLVAADFQKALRYAGGEAPKEYDLRAPSSFEECLWYVEEALKQPEVATDIENPHLAFQCFSLCWSEEWAVAIPVNDHWTGSQRRKLVGEYERLLCADSGPSVILQNGNHDTFSLERMEGFNSALHRMFDTMYAHSCLYPDIPKKLAILTSLYTDLPYYKDDYEESKRLADMALRLNYNGKDSLATFISKQHVVANPLWPEVRDTYERLTMGNLPAAQHIQRRGFRIDHKGWAALREKAEAALAPVQAELDAIAAPWIGEGKGTKKKDKNLTDSLLAVRLELKAERERLKPLRAAAPKGHKKDFDSSHVLECLKVQEANIKDMIEGQPYSLNVSSYRQVKDYFLSVHGVVRKSFDEKALQVLRRPAQKRPAYREAALILDIREQRKKLEAFLGAKLDLDGRFKCSVNIRGTKYGRLSSSKLFWRWGGNVMNLPKEFRTVFIADAQQGSRLPFFVNFDQSKAEAYHVAMLSGDKALLEECQGKVDGHAKVGELISGVPYEVVRAEHALLDETTDTNAVAAARASLPAWQAMDRNTRIRAEAKWPGLSVRYAGKRRRHAWNYRETPEGYSLRSGESLADAKAQDAILRRRYSGVVNWWDEVKWEVENRHKLVNCLGRVIPFMGLVTNDVWKSACSALPQSAVADVTNGAMRAIHGWNSPEITLCNNVYDSLLLQMYIDLAAPLEAEAERLMGWLCRIKKVMEPELTINGQSFTVPTDCKIGLLTFNGEKPEKEEIPQSRWGKMKGLKLTEEGVLVALEEIKAVAS